jgi:hypothetical protein
MYMEAGVYYTFDGKEGEKAGFIYFPYNIMNIKYPDETYHAGVMVCSKTVGYKLINHWNANGGKNWKCWATER